MIRRLRAFYNPWFIIPFLIWVFVAAVLLLIFDRRILFATVNTHHTPFLDVFMRKATDMGDARFIILLLCSMLVFRPCRSAWYVIGALVCNVMPTLLVLWLKQVFDAPRPLQYFKAAPWMHLEQGWDHLYHNSFPSGHTAGACSLFCFLALILPRRLAPVGLLLFGLALLVGYSRLYLGAHFFADVFAGSLVGTTTTIFCFSLLRKWRKWPMTIGARADTKMQQP